MVSSSYTERIESLEAEVAKLREQVDKLLGERQSALEAYTQSVRRQLGIA